MRTVLVTGFEPFGGADRNASWEAVTELARDWDEPGTTLVTARLPVTFEGLEAQVAGLVHEHRPELMLAVGLAAGRTRVGLERVALNLADARIPDNAGAQPVDEPVVPGGEPARWASLPVKAVLAAATEQSAPLELSLSAGAFVCNAALYHAAGLAAASQGRLRAGFAHVPESPGRGDALDRGGAEVPTMTPRRVAQVLALVLRTSLKTTRDAVLPGAPTW